MAQMIIDAHNHIGIEIAGYSKFHYPYAQSLEDLIIKAAPTPVSHWLVFPFVSYPNGSLESRMQPPAETPSAGIPYGLANENLLNEIDMTVTQPGKRALPVAILDPAREVAAQIKHLRTLRQRQRFYALKIQGTIIQSKVTELLGAGSAFLDLAAEWDCPFLIHSSILPSDIWSQAADLLRVAESRPDVRFVLAHSCRFHHPSLQRIAELPNTWFDCSAHRIHCELAMKENPAVAHASERFPSDYSDPATVLLDLVEAYPDKLIWGTDSPYYSWVAPTGELPESLLSSYQEEWDCVHPLPEPVKAAITKTNTLNWLGLHENDI